MINFIICDDHKEFTILLKKKIKEFMSQYKEIECEYHIFYGYGTEFEKMVQSENTFKVYFLDIETKKGSGLDATRIIREKYDDWNSIIMIVTSHEEFRFEALGNRLDLFDFLNKLSSFDSHLEQDLKNVLKKYKKISNSITLEYDRAIHKVELRDIIFIEKEIESKKCIVVTTYGMKHVQCSLNEINEKLNEDFMKVSRSLIVNRKKIKGFDSKTNTIYFIKEYESNLVSRKRKKELINSVRNDT